LRAFQGSKITLPCVDDGPFLNHLPVDFLPITSFPRPRGAAAAAAVSAARVSLHRRRLRFGMCASSKTKKKTKKREERCSAPAALLPSAKKRASRIPICARKTVFPKMELSPKRGRERARVCTAFG